MDLHLAEMKKQTLLFEQLLIEQKKTNELLSKSSMPVAKPRGGK